MLGSTSPSTGARCAARSSLVGHETFCYDDLTVRENLRFAARAVGPRGGRRRRRARAARARSGVADVTHGRLSPGQRRRLALADRARARARACCCSTSRTPASTTRAARCSTTSSRAAPAEGRTVLLASHELDLARRARRRARSRDRRPGQVQRRDAGAADRRRAPATGAAGRPAARGSAQARARELAPRGAARRGQGPAHRAPLARRAASRSCRSARSSSLLFAFALDPDRTLAAPRRARPVLGRRCCSPRCSRSARSFAVEEPSTAPATGCGSRGLDGGGDLPRARPAAIAVELLAARGRARRRRRRCSTTCTVRRRARAAVAAVAATVGLAATGTVYGVLAAGLRARETLVPLLVLPAVTPVMLGGDPGVRGRARRHDLGRVAVGAAARRVRGAVHGRSGCSPSGRCWRSRERMRLLNPQVARALGWATLASLAVLALFALWVAPPDAVAGRRAAAPVPARARPRGSRTSRSASPRSRRCCGSCRAPARLAWDLLAGASAEVGVVFTGLTLVARLALGPADLGHLVGVGRPPHHHRDPLLPLPRLPRAAAHRRDRRRARQALRDRRADRVRRRADRALLGHVVADAAPAGHRLQPEARTCRSTASMAFTLVVRRSSRSRCSTCTSCSTAASSSRELEEGLEERELERAIAERVRVQPTPHASWCRRRCDAWSYVVAGYVHHRGACSVAYVAAAPATDAPAPSARCLATHEP